MVLLGVAQGGCASVYRNRHLRVMFQNTDQAHASLVELFL